MSCKIRFLGFATTLLLLGGCQSINLNMQSDIVEETQTTDISWIDKYDTQETGVLVGIDEEKQTITVKKVDSGVKFTLDYTGATNVTDKYESVLTMKQLPIGEIVNVYYNSEDLVARKVEVSSDAWEYTKVENLTYDQTKKIIYIAGVKYRYGDSLTLISNEEEGNLLDLNEIDVVTVKGINKKIYSIIVTRGHGYISLENDETFIDGWIEVGNESVKPITEDMVIVASEGNHKVTVANNGSGGTKSITVKRNENTVVDVGDLKSATKKSGSLKFIITPSDATLYIDGVKTDYSELVVVDYGVHRVTVKSDGNDDYSQTIIVGSSYAEIEINGGTTSSSSSDSTDSTDTDSETSDSKDTTTSTTNSTDTTVPDYLNSGTTDTTDTDSVEDTLTGVLQDLLSY